MTVPVLTFFNNKGGVGKTSLVYHLAWMLSDSRLSGAGLRPRPAGEPHRCISE